METRSLLCRQCAAPLQIPEGTPYITCTYCHTPLVVHWEKTVAYTERVEQLEQKTDKIVAYLAERDYQAKDKQLDEDWEVERKQYMIKTQEGTFLIPEREKGMGQGILFLILGFILVIGSFIQWHQAEASWFWLFSLPFFGIGIYQLVFVSQKAKQYQLAEEAYLERKNLLRTQDFSQVMLSTTVPPPSSHVSTSTSS